MVIHIFHLLSLDYAAVNIDSSVILCNLQRKLCSLTHGSYGMVYGQQRKKYYNSEKVSALSLL